ncbi:MAG: hypothetical protein J6T10_26005 [Methanobrevibacter sp.]|nr:hypothetical protein [Methanobrevibacter sp.]
MSTLTTKLELKVMEGTDNLANTFQQGNYNANRLETLFGENLEDYQNLGTLTTRMNTIEGSLSALLNRTVVNEHDIDDLETAVGSANTKILALERLNNNIDVDGQTVNGYLEKYVLSVNSVGRIITVDIGDGKYFHKDMGYVDINLTSALNISTNETIVVESAEIYRGSMSDYQTSPLSLYGCGGKLGSYGKYIAFTGVNTSVNTSQEVSSVYDNVPYKVVLTILRESVE